MEKHILKFKTIVPLVTLLTISLASSLTSAHSSANTIKQLGSFIYKIEQQFTNFFDYNNNTSYKSFTNTMESILRDFSATLTLTKTRGNALQQEAHAISHYAHNQFNGACSVLKLYTGKGNDFATELLQKLQSQFNFETAFGHMKSKLQALSAKAKKEGDTQLVATINRFTGFIDKKRAAWNKRMKKWLSLYTAICYRIELR